MKGRKKFDVQSASQFEKHYNEDDFWDKLKSLVRKAGSKVIYPALQLYYLLQSQHVPLKDKALIVGALGYLILPADLIPDFVPLLGLTDDLTALMLTLRTVDKNLTPDIKEQARSQTQKLLGNG